MTPIKTRIYLTDVVYIQIGRFNTAQKKSFPLKISSVNVTKPMETADLVTFTEEILNGKLHCLYSVRQDIEKKAAENKEFKNLVKKT